MGALKRFDPRRENSLRALYGSIMDRVERKVSRSRSRSRSHDRDSRRDSRRDDRRSDRRRDDRRSDRRRDERRDERQDERRRDERREDDRTRSDDAPGSLKKQKKHKKEKKSKKKKKKKKSSSSSSSDDDMDAEERMKQRLKQAQQLVDEARAGRDSSSDNRNRRDQSPTRTNEQHDTRKRSLSRDRSRSPPGRSGQKGEGMPPKETFKVYVGNLNAETTTHYLAALYKPFGAVKCQVIMDRNQPGVSRGFAFVEFGTREAMEKAVEASDKKTVHDNEITVNEAKPARDKESSMMGGATGSRFEQRMNFRQTREEAAKVSDDANIAAYMERKKARQAEALRKERERHDWLEK